MKYIFYLFVAIVLVVVLLFSLLFSSVGNRVLQPIIENKVNSYLPFDATLETFRLNTKDFEVLLQLSEQNSIHLKARYNLMSQSIDGRYQVSLLDLSQFNELVDYPLQGALQTQGDIKGNYEFLHLRGLLALADGGGEYSLDIYEFEPKRFAAHLKSLNLERLFAMANLPLYAKGNLFIETDIDFSTFAMGGMKVFVEDGRLNEGLLQEEFDIDLPPSGFNANIDLDLGEKVVIAALVDSQLLKIKVDATTQNDKIDAKYEIDIQYLEALEPLIGVQLNGPLNISGSALGSKEKIVSKVVSDFASGMSRYMVVMDQFEPQSIEGKSQKINLESLFKVLNLPLFARGEGDIELNLQGLNKTKKGSVALGAVGRINNNYLQEEFEKHLVYNNFSLLFGADIDGDFLLGEAMLEMDMGILQLQNIDLNLQTKAFESDVRLHLTQLQKLKGWIERELEGEMLFVGNATYSVDEAIKVALESDSLGGETLINLDDNILQVDANRILVERLMPMVKIPIILRGETDADLVYDTQKSEGILKANFLDSHFAKSFLTDAIMEYAKVDLTAKKFEKAELLSKISGENIVSEFVFQMKNIVLATQNLHINTLTNRIRGDVSLILNNHRYNIKINGSLDRLQDAFDYQDLLRQEVQRQIERKAREFIEKELGEDLFQKFRGLF